MMLNKVANIEIDIQSSIQCCANEVLLFNVHPRWDSLRMGGGHAGVLKCLQQVEQMMAQQPIQLQENVNLSLYINEYVCVCTLETIERYSLTLEWGKMSIWILNWESTSKIFKSACQVARCFLKCTFSKVVPPEMRSLFVGVADVFVEQGQKWVHGPVKTNRVSLDFLHKEL